MTAAPFYADIAQGPESGRAVWLAAGDGTKLRVAHWAPFGAARGTVLLFQGRSEYAEKYGPAAAALTGAGWHVLAPDWRGQGLSQRRHPDPMLGHVEDFDEYQQDVTAVLDFARAEGLPEPWHLLSHSMGGCIALRALLRGLPVKSAVFSAPMWGIRLFPTVEPVAVTLSRVLHERGHGHLLTPTTTRQTYVLHAKFRGNMLTRDPAIWSWMRQQATAHPDLALGGPSLTWLHAAFREMQALQALPAPATPAFTALGTSERIISPRAVRRRMAAWPQGRLELFAKAEHEVMMELPAHRGRFLAETSAFFAAQS